MKRRQTAQRQAIFEALQAASTHLTAEELLTRAQAAFPSVNAATLYRNLDVLEEASQIRRIAVHGMTYFEPTTVRHHHFHCRSCERLIAIDADALPVPSAQMLATRSGFVAEQVSLLVEGICASCSASTEAPVTPSCSTCASLCRNVIAPRGTAEVDCKLPA